MKQEETEVLISYRLEQAQTALDDAKYLLEGQRSPQGIINRSYYAIFYATTLIMRRLLSCIPRQYVPHRFGFEPASSCRFRGPTL